MISYCLLLFGFHQNSLKVLLSCFVKSTLEKVDSDALKVIKSLIEGLISQLASL